MRIAYLTARYPFPPIGGDRVRVYHTLRHLLRSHKVTLYTLTSAPKVHWQSLQPDLPGLEQKTFQLAKSALAWNGATALFSDLPLQVRLYQCPDLVQTLDSDIRRGAFDLLFVHLIRMAEHARPFNAIPRILDMTDSIHLHYTRMPRFSFSFRGLAALIERDRLRRYETAVCSWSDHVLLASPLDIGWLRRRHSGPNLTLIPTGIELGAFPFHEGNFDPNRIIFVGKLDYLPNTDAAVYFARKILPKVRQAVPEAEFVVAGWNPPSAVWKLARETCVKVLPNVPDLRPEVTRSAVSVAPMRFGSGIQVKILESLALGTPAVATESVVGAFGQEGKRAILVGRSQDDFAEKVVSILKDNVCRERLRRLGRRLIEERFQWHQVLAPLDRILESLAEKRVEARQC
jgi:glycosyltransferase involved in cell wall biosynthesis